jgi:hypothetical protein
LILSIAHATVDEASRDNLLGAWSNLVVGDRPKGLVNCYLLEAEGTVQIAAVWQSIGHHDAALAGDEAHPASLVFAACGVEPTHTILDVLGHLS